MAGVVGDEQQNGGLIGSSRRRRASRRGEDECGRHAVFHSGKLCAQDYTPLVRPGEWWKNREDWSPDHETMDEAATVFVVDDDPAVLKSLARLLRASGLNVATYSSSSAFLEAKPAGPGCVLLDQSMPELSGLETQVKLAGLDGSLKVIFVTAHGNVPTSVQAMKAGAFDFLEKPADERQLLDTVQRALAASEAALVAQRERASLQARLRRLTARERQVVEHIVLGLLNKQIAYDLGISEKTIKVHRARALRKLEVGSVAELARMLDRASSAESGGRRTA
jgi:RNA polymerase sigma factor (sigma-70 family)